MTTNDRDREQNRFSTRAARYAGVGAAATNFAARAAWGRVLGGGRSKDADALKEALGGLKGPLMKVAQLLATIPEAVPAEYADAFAELQTNAPPMGKPFVRRRMRAELGPDWQERFAHFEQEAAAAASLGQVHRARLHDGRDVAVKLQYPDMASAVEADLRQLDVIFSIYKRMAGAVDPSEVKEEVAERLREELDYARERRHMALYQDLLSDLDTVHVPGPVPELSTGRLLTMSWMDGDHVKTYTDADQETRNRIAETLFRTWWRPFGRYAVIHGDPHMGNYQITSEGSGVNLLDFGCIRIFDGTFVEAVLTLNEAIEKDDTDLAADAYRAWGFDYLTKDIVEALNVWARFVYGPLLDDRVRPISEEDVSAAAFGRAQAIEVHTRLKELGPVTPPRQFVFMDRAAVGLGAVFIRLDARLNFRRLFQDIMGDFDRETVDARQRDALARAGLSADREETGETVISA
jgi:predicted unusual protein kinase regulating ubiquinone biosynthesis (AarF/ABC1/UbiB family)